MPGTVVFLPSLPSSKGARNFLHQRRKHKVTSRRYYQLIAENIFASHRMRDGEILTIFSVTTERKTYRFIPLFTPENFY
jgi:hypothetical protein